jgi:hypothetical protein
MAGRCVRCLTVFLVSAWAVGPVRADDPRAEFRFLIGDWVSEGKPGDGAARFTLTPDLGGKVLVRRHRADLPAAQGRSPSGPPVWPDTTAATAHGNRLTLNRLRNSCRSIRSMTPSWFASRNAR